MFPPRVVSMPSATMMQCSVPVFMFQRVRRWDGHSVLLANAFVLERSGGVRGSPAVALLLRACVRGSTALRFTDVSMSATSGSFQRNSSEASRRGRSTVTADRPRECAKCGSPFALEVVRGGMACVRSTSLSVRSL